MNKNRFFLISMLVVSLLLFMLRVTGLIPHIIVSVLGLAIMIPSPSRPVRPGRSPLWK